jgi:hypothetical protein
VTAGQLDGSSPEGAIDELGQLCQARLRHLVEVREPLVLISQIQRSGGTLLSQLFDGHPQCHAHPQEVHIGHPKKRVWPRLDLSSPESWFGMLREDMVWKLLAKGYRKENAAGEVFPFLFSPTLQELAFEASVAGRRPEGERDVLDCYFTSYFNAWLDNHNLYTGPKRIVTGFTARLAMSLGNVRRYFAVYPDGTLISIVRDPRGWYASARAYHKRYQELEPALSWWRRSVEAALTASERYPGRVVLLTYEQLVEEPDATIAALAERLGIEMVPELLTPSFNGRPIKANTSFSVSRYGVVAERSRAYRDLLDAEEIAQVERLAGDLYERAAERAL